MMICSLKIIELQDGQRKKRRKKLVNMNQCAYILTKLAKKDIPKYTTGLTKDWITSLLHWLTERLIIYQMKKRIFWQDLA